MPVIFYGKVTFRSLKGHVSIVGNVSTAMIRVGIKDQYVDTNCQECIWTINGTMTFSGKVKMFRGSYILVAENAELSLGGNMVLGSGIKLLCFENIRIGSTIRVAWECQIFDTSFHYIEMLNKDEKYSKLYSPVIIGDRVWVGNRTTISKGSVIPNDTIVASNSLVNKDFSEIEPYSMLVGVPAKPKIAGVKRIFDRKLERELDKFYSYPRTKL